MQLQRSIVVSLGGNAILPAGKAGTIEEQFQITRETMGAHTFFQEYDLLSLDLQSAASLIVERTLQYGDRAELHWLFAHYPRQQIRDWVKLFGKERLPHPHLDFWQIILEIQP